MVKIKICGITNLEDALASLEAGCDALGFLFYKKSPRNISPEKASFIIKHLPKEVIKIGVFVNAEAKTIKRIARLCKLNMLQFHGDESVEFCERFKKFLVIKTFRIKNSIDLENILRYKVFAYLFDAFVKSKRGGTGKKFDWRLAKHLKGIQRPIFLSGGLNAANVNKAIMAVRPDWLDVCSSLEAKPGKKDHRKIRKFVATAKGR